MAIKLTVAESNDAVRAALNTYLEIQPKFQVVSVASSLAEVLASLAINPSDQLLLSLQHPELSIAELIHPIRYSYPKLLILLLTANFSKQSAQDALNAGASGLILKGELPRHLTEGIETLAATGEYIDPGIQGADMLSTNSNDALHRDTPITAVPEIALSIGRHMALDGIQLEGLRIGGLLHNLGMAYLPSELFSKSERISESEVELIKKHPVKGYEILKNAKTPWPIEKMALQHHERMNGSGYPLGLKGNEILLESRILAVAEVVEAMSSPRAYRNGFGQDIALNEIQRGKTAYEIASVQASDAGNTAISEKYSAKAASYESDPKTGEGKKELMEKAKSLEMERTEAKARSPWYTYAGSILQIAIVLLSASILSVSNRLFQASVGVGVLGALLMTQAIWLWLPFAG